MLNLALEGKHSCSAPLAPLNLPDWSVSHTSLCSYLFHTSLCPSLSHTSLRPCLPHTSLCPCLTSPCARVCLTHPCFHVYLTHLPVSVSISHTSLSFCLSDTPPCVRVSHLPVSASHTSLCPCLTPPCVRASHLPGPCCRFISLSNERHAEIEDTHSAVTKTLEQIRQENEMAIKLKKQLEHEMVVLEERKAVRG